MTRTWDPHAANSWSQGSRRATWLAKLWADKTLSATEIAQIMGVNKNSVVGARYRLNLPPRANASRSSYHTHKPAPAPRPAPLPPRAVTLPPLASAAPGPRPAPRVATPEQPPAAAKVRMVISGQSADMQCCWPFGEPGTLSFRFCDAPRARIDRPYCEDHCKKAYTGYGGHHG